MGGSGFKLLQPKTFEDSPLMCANHVVPVMPMLHQVVSLAFSYLHMAPRAIAVHSKRAKAS